MKKVVTAVLLALALVGSVFAADNVKHQTMKFDNQSTFPLGAEARCFGTSPGTMIDTRQFGEIKLTEFVAGPNAGVSHLHGTFAVTFTVPSTGASGSGKIMLNTKGSGDSFVVTNVVHITGTRSDGTSFKTKFHFHTVVKNGDVKTDITKVNCVKP